MPLAVIATAAELLGIPLPHNWAEWLGMLVAIWAGLAPVYVAVLAFIEHHLGRKVEIKVAGHILPIGWIMWGALLICARPSPLRVLVVLLGLFAMLASAAELRRYRTTSVETGNESA
jgi:hypothetical protein